MPAPVRALAWPVSSSLSAQPRSPPWLQGSQLAGPLRLHTHDGWCFGLCPATSWSILTREQRRHALCRAQYRDRTSRAASDRSTPCAGTFVFSLSSDPTQDHQVIEQTLREVELAEAIGMDAVWLTEHHFDGAVAYADPVVFAAAVAMRTHRYASALRWWRWRCITRCVWRCRRRWSTTSVVGASSSGRGVAQPTTPMSTSDSARRWQQPREAAGSRGVTDQSLDHGRCPARRTLLAGHLPAPAAPPLPEASSAFWYGPASGKTPWWRWPSSGGPSSGCRRSRRYATACNATGRRCWRGFWRSGGADPGGNLGAEALRGGAKTAPPRRPQTFVTISMRRGVCITPGPAAAPAWRPLPPAEVVEHAFVAGTPKRVAEQIAALKQAGVRNLLLNVNVGQLPPEQVERSMRLFGAKVLPSSLMRGTPRCRHPLCTPLHA